MEIDKYRIRYVILPLLYLTDHAFRPEVLSHIHLPLPEEDTAIRTTGLAAPLGPTS